MKNETTKQEATKAVVSNIETSKLQTAKDPNKWNESRDKSVSKADTFSDREIEPVKGHVDHLAGKPQGGFGSAKEGMSRDTGGGMRNETEENQNDRRPNTSPDGKPEPGLRDVSDTKEKKPFYGSEVKKAQ